MTTSEGAMRARLRAARRHGAAPLTPRERHTDSRAALWWRVERAAEAGTPLVAIARQPGMPGRAELDRWLRNSDQMRARYFAALERQRLILAEELVVEADRRAEYARGRRRAIALRGQIAARTALLRLMAAEERAHAELPTDETIPARGISDEGVAILDRAAERFAAPASAANDDSNGGHAAEPHQHEADTVSVSSSSSGDALPDDSPSWSALRTARARSVEKRGADHPRVSVDDEKKNVDPRLRGDDERKNDEREETPRADSSHAESDEDEPDYAPEDARYRARRRDREAPSSPPRPPTEDKKSPWKPDTPTYVRFDDIGAGFDVSNQRNEGTGWDSYDPLR